MTILRAAVSDLRPGELVSRLGMSRSYASELVKRKKTPSLEVAARIEREFGVPMADWLQPSGDHQVGESVERAGTAEIGAPASGSSPGKIAGVSSEP